MTTRKVHEAGLEHHLQSSSIWGGPKHSTANQMWPWTIPHFLYVIFPLTLPFKGDFPAMFDDIATRRQLEATTS